MISTKNCLSFPAPACFVRARGHPLRVPHSLRGCICPVWSSQFLPLPWVAGMELSISSEVNRSSSPRTFYNYPLLHLPSLSSYFSEKLQAIIRELLHPSESKSTSLIALLRWMDSPCSYLRSSSPLALWGPPSHPFHLLRHLVPVTVPPLTEN